MSSSPITLASGYSSGLPVDDIITQLMAVERRPIDLLTSKKTKLTQQQTAFTNVKTRVDALLKSLQALTIDTASALSTDTDIFKGKKAASTDEKVATATANSTAASQTINLEVISLATSTKANSTSSVGALITGTTSISNAAGGGITAGNFTFFVNGVAATVAVASTDTIDDVLNKMEAANGAVNTSVSAGQIVVSHSDGTTVQYGATGDTSNFLEAMKLKPGVFSNPPGPNSRTTSSGDILAFNPNATITTANAGFSTAVTAGTFTINGKTFDTTGKTLNGLISEINNSGANVTASFNPASNEFQLLSSDPGSSYISMSSGTSNFLTAVRLVNGGDTTSSQTLGLNAQIAINGGPTISAPSNTVGETITGLSGVTLNLVKAQPGTPIQINITRDTDAIETAVSDFVQKFNDTMSYIDTQTKASESATTRGVLNGESSLKRFRQQLRQIVTDQIAGLSSSGISSLQDIGISTGAVTGSSTSASSTLVFDKTKFKDALAANPDAVRKIVNGTVAADGDDGTMVLLENLAKAALNTTAGQEGLFSAYDTSAANRIKSLNESIEKGEARLVVREANLRKQFLLMEKMITQYQSQSSALTSLQNQLAAQAKSG